MQIYHCICISPVKLFCLFRRVLNVTECRCGPSRVLHFHTVIGIIHDFACYDIPALNKAPEITYITASPFYSVVDIAELCQCKALCVVQEPEGDFRIVGALSM